MIWLNVQLTVLTNGVVSINRCHYNSFIHLNLLTEMTKEQRAPFEQKARDARGNSSSRGNSGSRGAHRSNQRPAANFNQTHPPPLPKGAQSDDLLQQQQEEEVRYEYRVNMVKSLINAMSNKNQLINTKLFVIASNIIVKTDQNQYLPLEIGIVQFSIKDGLTDSLHEFINPGPIPLGISLFYIMNFC